MLIYYHTFQKRLYVINIVFILQHMSTSPEQEPANFEDNIRACLQQMMQHPDPLKTQFQGNVPRCYKKLPDGSWKRTLLEK